MKYWRGFLIAGIFAAVTWAISRFAAQYGELVDMIYPYITRLIVTYLADWSAGVSACIWQIILLLMIAGVLTTIVLTIVLRWNPIQVAGWVLAAGFILNFFNTALYGLNRHAGPIAEDVQLEIAEYSVTELNEAARFFQTKAGELSMEVARDDAGELLYPSFEQLSKQACQGYEKLTYEKSKSVFAGSSAPVKALGWSGLYTSMGIRGVTVAMTGEAAVNPDIPVVEQPFIMCREIAHRKSIYSQDDATFAAFLACDANDATEFRYAAYFMAYRTCLDALQKDNTSTAKECVEQLFASENPVLRQDIAQYEAFYSEHKLEDAPSDVAFTDLLVSWHIQEFVIPMHQEDEEEFDPKDETQVDLSGLVNAKDK